MRRTVYGILIATFAIATVAVAADEVGEAIRLLKSKDTGQIIAGAQRVRALGPRAKKAAPLLVKHTGHKVRSVRQESRKALVSLGSVAAKRMLKTLKSSKNVDQRIALATAIAQIGRDMAKHSEALVKLLDDDNEEVRTTLAEALSKMSPDSQPALIRALGAKSPEVRDAAALALGKLGVAAIGPLKEALQSKNAVERAGAASALGRIGPKASTASRAIDALRKDEDATVRVAAVEAIGRIGGNTAHFVPALIKMFEDPDADVRWAAATAVSRFGEPAAPALVEALQGKTASYAGHALRRIGHKSEDALNEACDSDSAAMRAAAVRLLAEVARDIKRSSGRMVLLLKDDDAGVRRATADALAMRGARYAEEELLLTAEDPDASVRAAVARALAQLKLSEEVRMALLVARKDANLEVRIAAESARWSQGESSDILAMALAGLASDNARTKVAACRALSPMGRAAETAIPDLIAALEESPTAEVVDALGAITAAHGNGLIGRKARYKRAPAATKEAIEGALDWLARHQDSRQSGVNDADGRWHPKDFLHHHKQGEMSGPGLPLYSAGVTGLAVSVYLAIGRSDDPVVREGLKFLLRTQDASGILNDRRSQHFLIDQAFATVALCEAWVVTGDPRYRRAARRAIRACESARNPDLAWRYEPRGGENDTNVTTSMLFALAMAERGGIAVDPEALRGGARWITSVTDVPFGNIGYNIQGGSSARPAGMQESFPPEQSGAMTAAGLWGLALAERHTEPVPALRASHANCMDLTPLWRGGRRDMYYWYFATLVFHARQGKEWKKWSSALTKALTANQRKDPAPYAGSWDPVGPWGHDGGRVYSTAICALALATPYRMSPDFARGKPTGVYAKAAKALAKAADGKDPELSARAALWVRRIGG